MFLALKIVLILKWLSVHQNLSRIPHTELTVSRGVYLQQSNFLLTWCNPVNEMMKTAPKNNSPIQTCPFFIRICFKGFNFNWSFKIQYPHCAATIHNKRILSVNAQLYCSNYKWQLHVLATKQPSSGCIYQKYKRKLYTCSQCSTLVVAGNLCGQL